MIVELSELLNDITKEIKIVENISFDDSYIQYNDIKKLDNVKVDCLIFKDANNELVLKGKVTGKMLIEDSISLEDVFYPFSIEIDENIEETLQKNENSIDIIDILWQNIILEVPLRYTTISDLSKFNGDGWKLVDEDNVKHNNPFSELKEKLEEEW